ncbi:MAG: hypothetical protein EHM40_16115 [Chloroflexi bacterium]|nr:MAG: hypothetical protein EHM40_16115 [Chloroflexota bacterium]
MNLTKPVKIIIGIATLWYVLYPILFIGGMFMSMGMLPFLERSGLSDGPFTMFPFFGIIFPLHFCTIFVGLGLMAFYLVHVIKNTRGNETIRIILAIGNYVMPFISMPIYYYLYIWLENPPEWAAAKVSKTDQLHQG